MGENENYIENFESNFESYIDNLFGVIYHSGEDAGKAPVQALVDSYHKYRNGLSPLIPNYNTLLMLIRITKASPENSGENQSLKISEMGVEAANKFKSQN